VGLDEPQSEPSILLRNRQGGVRILDVEVPLDKIYLEWARSVKQHQLVDVTLPLLDLLHVGRGVALPLVWMLAPFFRPHALDPLEKALDHPEILLDLRDYLGKSEASTL
jgi:hypothetical protein